MAKYILKRILYFIPVLFGIVLLVYFIMYLAPGDPARVAPTRKTGGSGRGL